MYFGIHQKKIVKVLCLVRKMIIIFFFSLFSREVNPTFETHQQHDAHELLVCLLDNVRETCLALAEARNQAIQDQNASEGSSKGPTTRSGGSSFKTPWSRNRKTRKAKAKEEQQVQNNNKRKKK